MTPAAANDVHLASPGSVLVGALNEDMVSVGLTKERGRAQRSNVRFVLRTYPRRTEFLR